MSERQLLATGVLWAAAILAAAIVGAPSLLTLVLLPCLGATAYVIAARRRSCGTCRP